MTLLGLEWVPNPHLHGGTRHPCVNCRAAVPCRALLWTGADTVVWLCQECWMVGAALKALL